jgi:hypothetical protein
MTSRYDEMQASLRLDPTKSGGKIISQNPKSSVYMLGAASTVAVIFTARKWLSSKARKSGDKSSSGGKSSSDKLYTIRNPKLRRFLD